MQSIYGLLAEFDTPEQVVEAARHVHAAGYRRIDGYSPHPVEGLAEALDKHNSRLPLIVLVGGLVGCIGGYLLQWWCQTNAYPLNIGGRPLNSWPAYVPIMFELTVLIGSFSAVFGMLGLNGLPMPYHPLFNVPAFSAASRNKFFLCVEARDPLFSAAGTRQLLERLGPQAVYEVPP
ncbi:MAG: DUF3341 domain-containing protein [Pirellulales bacterium]|nr:DUF3341 domain-containing protein [Pirellulales bacterium]